MIYANFKLTHYPLVVIGLILYLINVYVPMESRIKTILNIAVIVFVIVWLLQAFGILGSLREFRLR